jgi:hypothetical protein
MECSAVGQRPYAREENGFSGHCSLWSGAVTPGPFDSKGQTMREQDLLREAQKQYEGCL